MKSLVRVFFFLLSLICTLAFSIKPDLLIDNLKNYNIYYAMVCIIGICFGFIYGIGYNPNSKFLRIIMNPIIILILIIGPLIVINV